MVSVEFPIIGKSIEIEKGSKISDACEKIGHPLNLVCGGKGRCGKCEVDIQIKGTTSTVLACQVEVSDGLKVMITGEEVEAQILTSNMLKHTNPNPSTRIVHVKHDELVTPLCGNDYETLLSVIDLDLSQPPLEVLQKFSTIYHNPEGLNIILYNDEIVDILPGDSTQTIYGLAFDIGSTSVVGYLFDLKTYEQVGISSRLNKQTSIGGDVISRIDYAISNPDGLRRLNKLVVESVNEIIENICTENNIDKNNIYQASFCGNSTMQHLFLGLYPSNLGLKPFSSTTHRAVLTNAKSLSININSKAKINFLPLLGGFVGADTAAVLLSIQNDDKNRLVIDLGTNGELGVGKNNDYKVTSCACGPALEGAGLEYGMRGTKGAIERVTIANGQVFNKVIGGVKPQGICGSGIIDIVAELSENNIVNSGGTFIDPSKIEEPELAKRVIKTQKGKAFIIAYGEETESGEPLLMTQQDIRQVQLAKAAIYTGCLMLIEECGLKGEDLEEILIAGAFGNYIDINKAQAIGMIPHFENVPVYSIGNAAATGSLIFLLSREEQEEGIKLASKAEHIEIASNPNFVNGFIMNTSLKLDEEDDE